ncbi:hypothetical protein ACQP2E_00710 [Actinoplanes sp. CA-015351]|uniref:hypothetical protein n=1 Tax=Actinoplanes sp. CA-015351 TaxID=3239897 RepID=UPI003D989209
MRAGPRVLADFLLPVDSFPGSSGPGCADGHGGVFGTSAVHFKGLAGKAKP